MSLTTAPTNGEKLLNKLLRDLPRKQFFFHYEPQLNTPDGNSSKPDFVVVAALLGVIVIEVKDWVKITGGDQQLIHTVRSTGAVMSHENPVLTAQRYAYDLNRRFEQRVELWEQYKGRKQLKFPWQVMVALPRISQRVIEQFEKKGIWPRGTVIGKELLHSTESLQQLFTNLPWKFTLEQPLSLDMLDIVREVLNPSLMVENESGLPVGTLTELQHGLINEPLHTVHPQQLTLFEYEPMSDETQDIPGSASVRLVRGVAGSGKTLVLIRRAQYLISQYPEARLLMMSFNVELARDLKGRLRLSDQQVTVASFHKVCRKILGDHWREPLKTRDWLRQHERENLAALGLPAEFVATEFAWRKEMALLDDNRYLEADRSGRGQRLERNRREIINSMFNRYRVYQSAHGYDWDDVAAEALAVLTDDHHHPLRQSYDAILIDEGQDFAPSWMQLTLALLKPNGDLLICDDPSQSIFNTYSWSQKGLSVVGRTRILQVPFRSTREISRAAHSLIEADDALRSTEERAEPDFSSYELGSGPLPALMACADSVSETTFIDDKIRDLLAGGAVPGKIAILCHAKWHVEQWAEWARQGIYVQNFEKIKGLEFMVVFIPHLHDAFPHSDDPDAVTVVRRKLFTAMTRARYRLVMSYQSLLPKPLEPLLPHMWCESVAAR
ncbi:MAG: AAA family ATPase [Anaerolineaceae bacterium]|nr:AAA family ATPase [Anaerolineaceae bacterium]